LPPPRVPAKKISFSGQSTSAFCGPSWGRRRMAQPDLHIDRQQSRLHCVRIPVIQLQRVAEIRFASIETNVTGSNPKRPMHEDVHCNI
jgi:hypothetical protein